MELIRLTLKSTDTELNQNVTQIANTLRILYVKIFLENLEYKTNELNDNLYQYWFN